MEICVYDKAKWHLENGVPADIVLEHFRSFSEWCITNCLFTQEGEELAEMIDEEYSLYSGMFTEKGNAFMKIFYTRFFMESTRDYFSAMDYALHALE